MSEFIKIGLVGAGSTGKTTLIDLIDDRLGEDVEVVREAARDYFDSHPHITDRFGFAAQAAIQDMVVMRERAAQAQALILGHGIIVCDRTVLDAAVYVHSVCDDAGAQQLLDRARPWLPSYDKIFLLDPTDCPLEIDGVRSEDVEGRERIHASYLRVFKDNEIPYRLLSGDVEQRYVQVAGFALERTAV